MKYNGFKIMSLQRIGLSFFVVVGGMLTAESAVDRGFPVGEEHELVRGGCSYRDE